MCFSTNAVVQRGQYLKVLSGNGMFSLHKPLQYIAHIGIMRPAVKSAINRFACTGYHFLKRIGNQCRGMLKLSRSRTMGEEQLTGAAFYHAQVCPVYLNECRAGCFAVRAEYSRGL